MIIAVHNEARRIRAKLENSLAIDYPHLELIVSSDNCTDATNDIVEEFAPRGVVLVSVPDRRGKEFAQQQAIARACGSIFVFSDVGTRIERDALRQMIRYFNDPAIGAVSSEDRLEREDGAVVGEGLYVRYEMALRRLESSLGGLVGLSGSFFAARRSVCQPWDVYTPSDLNVALNCARMGLRAVSAPDVIGFYRDLRDGSQEYRRKMRTVLRGMTGLVRHRSMMMPWCCSLFGWQVLSHKLMRWLVPAFLVGLFTVSLALREQHWLYESIWLAQAAVYSLALAAHYLPVLRGIALVRIVYFFCQANIAIAHAALSFLAGRRMSKWQPSVR
jgi:glycosyltransferase involved in cell wall biosynthesis